MAIQSKNYIVKTIRALAGNVNIDGTVKVVINAAETEIDISFDNRKYIGRLRLEWSNDRFAVYMMDKKEGKVTNSEYHAAKSVYLLIKTAEDARKFVKWYELTTQLAAMRRDRK